MKRRVIAIDIDDVLAANAPGFVAYSNLRWGTTLRPEDYHEHWSELWQTEHEETNRRSLEIHHNGIFADYKHDDKALPVLVELKKDYSLVIATSRRQIVKDLTLEWINKHYKNIFDGIYFAGIFDAGHNDGVFKATKVDMLREFGADYLIDDQIKHCYAAAQEGIKTVLFGDYVWNQVERLPENVTRCNDWLAVGEYFRNAKS